jgi:hypothetical protein
MAVRLLRGDFWRLDGGVLQDFEALPEGPIAIPLPQYGVCDLITGADQYGGCSLEYAILLPRES